MLRSVGINPLFRHQKAGGLQLHLLSTQAAATLLSMCQLLLHIPLPGEARLNPPRYVTMPFTGLCVTSPGKKSLSWVICC